MINADIPLWRKMRASKKMWAIVFGCIFLLAGFFSVNEYRFRLALEKANPGTGALTLFTIESGSSARNIAEKLYREGFILAADVFEKYVRRQNVDTAFQAGLFHLPQNLTIPDLVNRLVDAAKREEFFTIPEGLNLGEIDELIAAKGYLEKGDFLKCVRESCNFSEFSFLPKERGERSWEGYFFPETYAVYPSNFSAEDLGKKMLREFEKRAEKLDILKENNVAEIVIIASMIEKESRNDAERPVISGILWKRLREGWALGVDATVRYFTGKKTSELTVQDLNADSPYNTRIRTGLPPTAICNPGEASLKAAAEPQTSPYYYYLHGADGNIYYARTNEQHNLNKQKYL